MSTNGRKVEELEVGTRCGSISYHEAHEAHGDNGRDHNVREPGPTHITDLVDDVLTNIWKRLPPRDLRVASFVSKDWEKKMASHPFVDEYAEEWETRYEDIPLLAWAKTGEPYPTVALDTVMKC